MATQDKAAGDALIARHIDAKTDDRGPAYARLVDYGTPVWGLIGYLRAVGDEMRDEGIHSDATGLVREWRWRRL